MTSTIPNERFSRSHSQSGRPAGGFPLTVRHLPGGGVALPGDVIDDGYADAERPAGYGQCYPTSTAWMDAVDAGGAPAGSAEVSGPAVGGGPDATSIAGQR